MTNQYAILGDTNYFSIVSAENKLDALKVVSENLLRHDNYFSNYVSYIKINESLADYFLYNQNHLSTIDFNSNYTNKEIIYIKKCIYNNLVGFWPQNSSFVDEYYEKLITLLFSNQDTKISLSIEISKSAAVIVLQKNLWFETLKIIKIDNSQQYQLISIQ